MTKQQNNDKNFGREHFSKIALGFFLCFFLCFLVFTMPFALNQAQAQSATPLAPPPPPAKGHQVQFGDLPENKRLRILIRMAKGGAHKDAGQLLAAHPFKGNHAQNRTLFLHGLIAKAARQYDIATTKFRAALADDPKLTMVRAELAHTLFITKQDDGAKHHLQLLAGSAPTPEAAKQFDRFIEAVDARRPWKLSAYISMAPSTNFNNGTTRQTIGIAGAAFSIDANSRKQSGIGIRGGTNASYAFKPSKDVSIIVGGGINFIQYQGNTFDDTIISQDVSVNRAYKSGRIAIGVSVSERFSGEDEFILEAGPYVSVTHNFSNKNQLFVKARHLRTDFKQASYRNGGTTTLDMRLSHAFATDMVFYLLSGGQRTDTKREHLDYWAFYGGAAVYKELPFGITFYGEGKLTKKYFDGNFPLLFEPQKDTKVNLTASITKRDFSLYGFAPRLNYNFTKSISNSVFSEYSSHGANLSMTKAF